MKKSIKTIGILALTLVTLFACQKEDNEVKKEERFSVQIKVASAKGGEEKAILIGTKAELEAALKNNKEGLYLKKVSKANNIFVPVGTGKDQEPTDNFELCWDEINAYYNENIQQWQQQANRSCRNVLQCITCPNAGGGLFVMYDIAPNSIDCILNEAVAVQYAFELFPFSDGEYEDAAVAEFISEKK